MNLNPLTTSLKELTTSDIVLIICGVFLIILVLLILLKYLRIKLIGLKIKVSGYDAIVQTVSYGVQEISLDGTILNCNEKYCEIIGHDLIDINNKKIWDFISDRIERNKFKNHFNKMVKSNVIITTRRLKLKTKKGRAIDVQVIFDFIKDKNNNNVGLVCTTNIITDVIRAERRQLLAQSIFDILNTTKDVTTSIERILYQFKTSTRFDAIAIRLYEEHDGPYYKAMGYCEKFNEVQKCIDKLNYKLKNGIEDEDPYQCFCGAVLSGRKLDENTFTEYGSFWSNSFGKYALKDDNGVIINPSGSCFKLGYQTVALIPLKIENRIIGLLQLNDRRKSMLTNNEVSFYEGIGNSISIALSRKKTNEMINGIFESAPIGIGVTRNRMYLEVNDFFCRMLGYTRNQIINKSAAMLYPSKQEYDRVGGYVNSKIKDNTPGSITTQFQTREGKILDVLLNASRIGEVGELIVTVLDITDIKIADQKYKSLFNHMHEGFALHKMIFDVNENPIDYEFLAVNPAFENLTGLKSKDIINKKVSEVLPGIEDEWINKFGNVVRTGRPANFQNEANDLGKIYEVNAYKPDDGQFACIFKDITESKKQEREIRERQRRFDLLVKNLFDGFAMVDIARGFISCNPAFEKIVGYNISELKTMTVEDVTDPEDWKWEKKYIEELIQGTTPISYEKRYINKDGKTVDVDITPYPIHDINGSVIQLWGIVRDLTKEKKAKSKLDEKEKQLRKAAKMDAVGTLAGGIAHDFNNIIQIIQGNVEILQLQETDTKLLSMLNSMHEASERGSDLARRLLTFSSRVESKLKPTNINDEIEIAQKLLNRHATWPVLIDIKLDLQEDLDFVLADTTQINQVITNLCINAKDAMPDGGHITIKSSIREIDEVYVQMHTHARVGKYVQISVTDTGFGMSQDLVDRIFEPFFTTKETGKGTGLGLAVVYGILKNHKGFISVYSEPDVGTEFKIHIPAIDEKYVTESDELEEIRQIKKGTETILIIDDEEAIRVIGESILTNYGYKVLTAEDGEQGLKTFNKHRDEIALVVLDLVMPNISGSEVLSQLIELKPDAKIIVASGYSTNGPIKDAMECGAKKFINKPYTLHELLLAIRDILDEE